MRVNENGIIFKILGNPLNVDSSGNPLPVFKVFGNFFKYVINGTPKYVKRNSSGKDDKIFMVIRSLKKMYEENKNNNHELAQQYLKELSLITSFLKVSCENLVLGILPETSDIKVLDLKTSVISTLFSEYFYNFLDTNNCSFYDLGSPENNLINGWLKCVKVKTGPNIFDIEYKIDLLQGQEQLQLADGSTTNVLCPKKLGVNRRIYELEEKDVPNLEELTQSSVWTQEEEINFANVFNFPSFEEYCALPYEHRPTFAKMQSESINALPATHKNRVLGIRQQVQQPAQQVQQPAQEPAQQVQEPAQQVQQPVQQPVNQQQQQPVQEPVQQPVNQQQQQPVQEPVQQPVNQQQQPAQESSDDISAMLDAEFDNIDF